ncbi:MAG: SAM-dependent methyltransferase [Gammaproteobacteria bacterium]|jgi:SAM-dependent methyltransferase
MNRPYSESCEQNKAPIYEVIEPYLKGDVLEIGSGTGQHAVHFAGLKPDIIWHCSDLAENIPGIAAWIQFAALTNLPKPFALDVMSDWPSRSFDLIYTANSFHIMGEAEVKESIRGVASCLSKNGIFIVYGPFNYNGQFSSDSNRQFEQWLKARNPKSGIKDAGWLEELGAQSNLELLKDISMPANNRILIWQTRTL